MFMTWHCSRQKLISSECSTDGRLEGCGRRNASNGLLGRHKEMKNAGGKGCSSLSNSSSTRPRRRVGEGIGVLLKMMKGVCGRRCIWVGVNCGSFAIAVNSGKLSG